MAQIKDVAKLAGVSPATVSNVINNSKYVSDDLRQKVEKAIKETNFKINKAAKSLRCKQSKTIGVVLQNICNAFFPEVLHGIEDIVHKEGYELLFCNTYYKPEKEKYHIDALRNQWVDGIILDSCINFSEDSGYYSYIQGINEDREIPVVVLEQVVKSKNVSSISIDNFKAGFDATQHLIENGHKRIVHISGPLKYEHCLQRFEGYKKALRENKISFESNYLYEGDFRAQSGYEAASSMIMKGLDFDGVFASNDQMAIGAIKAFKEYNIQVPEKVAVVGLDNIFASTLIEPSLTTINVPRYHIGTVAAEMLCKRIRNPETVPEAAILPANIIVRQSTSLRGDKNWSLYGW